MAAVIDASFAATLFLPDESSARSSEHFASAASTGIIAPALWQVEVTNIVVTPVIYSPRLCAFVSWW